MFLIISTISEIVSGQKLWWTNNTNNKRISYEKEVSDKGGNENDTTLVELDVGTSSANVIKIQVSKILANISFF